MARLLAISAFPRHASAVTRNHDSLGTVIIDQCIFTYPRQAKTAVIHGIAAFITNRDFTRVIFIAGKLPRTALKNTESRQSTGYLGPERTESRQSTGYLGLERTEPRQSTGYMRAERAESNQSSGYLGAKRTESRQSTEYQKPNGLAPGGLVLLVL